MAKDEDRGPVSAAGLMRYFDVSGGGIEVKPETVVIVSLVLIALVIIADLLV